MRDYDKLYSASQCAVTVSAYCIIWRLLYDLPHRLGADRMGAAHVLIEGAIALLLLVLAARDEPLGRPVGKPRRAALAAAAVLALPFIHAATQMYCLRGFRPPLADPALISDPEAYLGYALRTCVTAPLMEELGCRWIAFGKTRRRFGFWPSALVSVLVFSEIHISVSRSLAVSVVPFTLLCCLVYEVTGKLRWCVALHAANNLLCLPGMPWTAPEAIGGLYGVPMPDCLSLLMSVTAVIFLLCAYREKLFVKHGPAPGGADGAPAMTA